MRCIALCHSSCLIPLQGVQYTDGYLAVFPGAGAGGMFLPPGALFRFAVCSAVSGEWRILVVTFSSYIIHVAAL